MHAFIAAKARAGAPPRARSILARAGAIWIWPGVPLTEKRGASSVPVAADVARFWISRLHGPAADEARALRCLAEAVRKLNSGDEAGAQSALDSSGLARLSPDGAALGRALAASLNIAPLELPSANGPRLWTADDVAAHAALFKDHAHAAGLLAKAGGWEESKHPRVPAGSPGGGQFQGGQGGGVAEATGVVEGRSAASGDGGEELPEIPKQRPPTRVGRRAVVRGAANWLGRAKHRRAVAMMHAFSAILEATGWLRDEVANIRSSLDGPKSLEELQRAAEEPAEGYQIHHIVEQTPARADGFPRDLIEAGDNKVLIPTFKHRDITGWYMTKNDDFGGKAPRDYLKGRSWEDRRNVGIDALLRFKVLRH